MKFLLIVLCLCFVSCIASQIRVKRRTINDQLTIEYTREASKDVKCEISVRDLLFKHPIFLKDTKVIIPINGQLRFHLGDRFQVNCVNSNFPDGVKGKTVECTGKDQFSVEVDGQKNVKSLSDFNSCTDEVKLSPVKGINCDGGYLMHMRFLIESNGYFDLYSSCYDETKVSTIYNNYILYGKAFDNSPIIRPSSSFAAAIIKNNICDKLYTARKYNRGHLMPFADGIYPGWRKQTNYFINAKPQKTFSNSGAWSRLELAIREEAKYLRQELKVFTGAFESMSFLEIAESKIEVHKFWYKVVVKGDDTGVAFISCNDGTGLCKDKLKDYCTDVCEGLNWGILKNIQDEKVFCCELNDFYVKTKVPKIPGTERVTLSLKSLQNPPAPGA
ncbi:unnamed protein product [Diamesa serratosioi]